jgi:hypothetical protein
MAKQALDQGADVVFGAGGNTGNGAIQEVAKSTITNNVYCIGVDYRSVGHVARSAALSRIQRDQIGLSQRFSLN